MKFKFRKAGTVILAVVLFFSIFNLEAVSATSINDTKNNMKIEDDVNMLRIGLVERKKYVRNETVTTTVTPAGQDDLISFNTPGAVFIYEGGPTVSMSFNWGGNLFSLGVDIGYVSKNGYGGYIVNYPPDGKTYRVIDTQTIECKIYKVELYDQEQGKVLKTYYKAERDPNYQVKHLFDLERVY